MGYRFRRSFKIAPGVRWNTGMRSSSVSIGGRGFGYNVSSRGIFARGGIPGTGLSYKTKLGSSKPNAESEKTTFGLKLGIFPDGEIGFYEGEKLENISPQIMKLIKSQQRSMVEKWLKEFCESENEELTAIRLIHLKTPSLDEPREYEESAFIIPAPTEPILKRLGFWGWLLKKRRQTIELYNTEIRLEHQRQVDEWHELKKKYQEKERHRKVAFDNRNCSVEAMETFLTNYLPDLTWPRETSVSFDIFNDGAAIVFDVDLPEIEDMPNKEASVIGRSLKITYKERAETNRRKDYMMHVHGIGFRLIGEIFSYLPAIETVLFSGYSQRLDRSLGTIEDQYLYSLKVSRLEWREIELKNLKKIDPVECMARFNIRRKMTKTGIFTPIEPFRLENDQI